MYTETTGYLKKGSCGRLHIACIEWDQESIGGVKLCSKNVVFWRSFTVYIRKE